MPALFIQTNTCAVILLSLLLNLHLHFTAAPQGIIIHGSQTQLREVCVPFTLRAGDSMQLQMSTVTEPSGGSCVKLISCSYNYTGRVMSRSSK